MECAAIPIMEVKGILSQYDGYTWTDARVVTL